LGKVVTSKGMQAFVETGAHETIKNDKPKKAEAAPLMEVKKEAPILEVKTEKPTEPEETGLEAEDHDLAERAQARIAKKHREMKQADALAKRLQQELNDTETFSKSQFDRARMAEEKLTTLERELAEIRSKSKPEEKTGLMKPDPKDPKYYDAQGQFKAFEYAEELAGYSATKAVDDDRKRQATERQQQEQDNLKKAFEARLEKARETYKDWKEVVGGADIEVPPYVQQLMVRSPYGGDLGYWFAKNPDEAKRIFALEPIEAVAEIGEIQAQWKKKPDTEKSNVVPIIPKPGAPAPTEPLNTQGQGSVNVDPAKMDFKQLRAYEREKAQSKRR